MAYADAPQDQEIEISVFSKGIGESILLRFPNGEWIIIDSLLADEEPVALRYLRDIGVELGQVKLVIATHWHDDHIRGLAEIAEQCATSAIVYSTVLFRDEFKAAVSNLNLAQSAVFSSGVSELKSIGKIIKISPGRRKLASARCILFEKDVVRVESLSPSHEDIHNFLAEIENWGSSSDIQRVATKPTRNDTSVAVAVHVDKDIFLFGADLEVRGALSGWQAVHEQAWDGRGRGSFYKIAHHGSVTGHYEAIWTEMLISDALAALTPYNRGRKKLPAEEDVGRILDRTSKCYSAGSVDVLRSKRQPQSVQKTLNEAEITVWRVNEKLGQTRFRKKPDHEWTIELFGSAQALTRAA